jgi:hypothetical protein
MFRKIYSLTTSQSKVLIAKGIVELPQVKTALSSGKIFLSRGITNAFVLDELYRLTNSTPKEGFNKANYVMGQVYVDKKFVSLGVNPGAKLDEVVFDKGKPQLIKDKLDAVSKFKHGDIVIKGGNALDPDGLAGVYVGDPVHGGTIGTLIGCIVAKGLELLIPIGLEKLVFNSIEDITVSMGIENMQNPPEGMKIGMMPLHGTVFTELDAFMTLFEVDAMHIGSGGVGGAEGCVSILVTADDEAELKKVDKLMQTIVDSEPFKCNKS